MFPRKENILGSERVNLHSTSLWTTLRVDGPTYVSPGHSPYVVGQYGPMRTHALRRNMKGCRPLSEGPQTNRTPRPFRWQLTHTNGVSTEMSSSGIYTKFEKWLTCTRTEVKDRKKGNEEKKNQARRNFRQLLKMNCAWLCFSPQSKNIYDLL